jgi:hypothetical protein
MPDTPVPEEAEPEADTPDEAEEPSPESESEKVFGPGDFDISPEEAEQPFRREDF